MTELKETVYSSDSQLLNLRAFLREMIVDARACRFLAWRLFVRNMAAQHRQTALGYLWLLFPPIVQTLVWVFLNSQHVISISSPGMPYPVFVLAGTVLWQGFSEALLSPIQQVQSSRQMLTKLRFPHEAILLAAMGQVLVNLFIRLSLLAVVLLWFRIPLSTNLLLAPFGILALTCFGMMIGLLLLPVSLLYGDVQRMLGMAASVWFFVTPVIYPPPTDGWAALVTRLNPVTPLLVTSRQWLVGGELAHVGSFLAVSAITIVLTLCGWIVYRIAMPHLIERIGS